VRETGKSRDVTFLKRSCFARVLNSRTHGGTALTTILREREMRMNGRRASDHATVLLNTALVTDWRAATDHRSFRCRIVAVDSVVKQSARDHTKTALRFRSLTHCLPTARRSPVGNYGWSRLKRRVSVGRVARARGPLCSAAAADAAVHQTIREHTFCIFIFYRESTSCPLIILVPRYWHRLAIVGMCVQLVATARATKGFWIKLGARGPKAHNRTARSPTGTA